MALSTMSANLNQVYQTGNRIGDILSEEIWDYILSFAQRESRYELHEFADLIPVSKAWANLAQPRLYNDVLIYEELHEDHDYPSGLLPRLAAAFLDVPYDHPKRTWLRRLELDIDYSLDNTVELEKVDAAINNWLTIIFARSSRLQQVCIRGSSCVLQTGPMAVLADLSRVALVELEITVDGATLANLCLIPRLTNLQSLVLRFESNVVSISSVAYPPLHMPTVSEFECTFYTPQEHCSDILRYLSGFQFRSNCKFSLRFPHSNLTSQDGRLLDPLFLNHDSDSIILDLKGQFVHPTVLHRTQRLYFWTIPPASLFRDVTTLPSVLRLHISKESNIDNLFDIMNLLASSHATFDTCMQIRAYIIGHAPIFRVWNWFWVPEGTITELDMRMTTRLLQFSRLLRPRGIHLADYNGLTMDLPSARDPRLLDDDV